MAELTIFSAPKAFEDAHISRIQRNAIRSWKAIGTGVQVLIIGNEPGIGQAAKELEVEWIPEVQVNEHGTPTIRSIFELAEAHAEAPILCYANTDVLLLPDFDEIVSSVRTQLEQFLIIGRRWDLRVDEELEFTSNFEADMREGLQSKGRMHPPGGSDYFVYPKSWQVDIPPFALGRAGWDNWMIYAGRATGVPVVDATEVITVIHQDHDYSHLPGGEAHYRHPESDENVQLAGGREMIFTLRDADWLLTSKGLQRKPWTLTTFGRRVESAVYARLGPGRGSRAFRLFTHPSVLIRYLKDRIGT